jgi:hypothetical protein
LGPHLFRERRVVRRIVCLGVTVLALLAASSASSRPPVLGTEDACACGGLKELVAGWPIGDGVWRCVYVVNRQTIVYENHYGGC